jgi:hypothetical protein
VERADPGGYVIISGWSLGANGGGAGFNCTAQATDGQFTVPLSRLTLMRQDWA